MDFGFHPVPKKRPEAKCECDYCGKVFKRRKDSINRYKNNYCSKTCSNKANGNKREGKISPNSRKGKYKKCVICEKEYYVRPSRVSSKYCSHKCHSKDRTAPKNFLRKDNSGKNNGMYKHGKRTGTHLTKRKLREEIIKRDGNWCLLCGKPPKGLHIHRIIYGSHGGKYNIKNCIQLCFMCHGEVHSSKKKWQKTLLNYIEVANEKSEFQEPKEPPSYWTDWIKTIEELRGVDYETMGERKDQKEQ